MDETRRLPLPDGVTLGYRLWRAPDNPGHRALVLLHGLASNHTRWSEFTEQTTLKQNWDILRPDLRGHGESLTRRPINLEIWCDDLARLLDAEGVHQAVLAGHSLGAQVALCFAARHPGRVAGLALIDPVYRPALRSWLGLARLFAPLLRVAATLLRGLNRLGLRRRQIPLRDLRALDEITRAALAKSGATSDIVRRYTAPLADLKHFPTAHYLQELVEVTRALPPAGIRTPVLVLLSKGVTFTDPAIMRAWIAQFPAAEMQTIDAWHWPLTERPVEVREAVEKFCEGIARQRA
jgi:pimeloyl-ACP methyl ester carboxylesterase